MDREQFYQKIDVILNFILETIKRGLAADGELPGTIKLNREAS
ncbi:MAG: hypothetical protein WCX28_03325 [Bacteriovoracaceae bacterium]